MTFCFQNNPKILICLIRQIWILGIVLDGKDLCLIRQIWILGIVLDWKDLSYKTDWIFGIVLDGKDFCLIRQIWILGNVLDWKDVCLIRQIGFWGLFWIGKMSVL